MFLFRLWYRRSGRQVVRWVMTVLAVVVVTLAVGWVLFVPVADWLAVHDVGNVTGPLRASSLQTARDGARGRLLTFAAGLFAVGALVYTARNFSLSREGQVTDRYTKAIEQVGSDKLDVRIGGIYALERVARDSARDHPTVIEVLCAFIREHSHEQWPPPERGADTAPSQIRPDVQAALTVVARRNSANDRQRTALNGANLICADLRYADLIRADLTDADLSRANLNAANLTNANLTDAKLAGANLEWARLTVADFTCADLTNANLTYAKLTDGNLTSANLVSANLRRARFHNDIWGVKLANADLTRADLTDAVFARPHSLARDRLVDLTDANFTSANLTRADLTWVDLTGADLTGADLSGARIRDGAPHPMGWVKDPVTGLLKRV